MNIHEYQAKDIFRAAGMPTPTAGKLATSADEAVAHFDALGGKPVMVKAQVHAGGRGKGGGVKYVRTREECKAEASRILANPLITHQTGPQGVKVVKLLIEEATEIAHEYYAAIAMDRAIQRPVLMVSTEGGMDIEEVAARTPEKILRAAVDVDRGLADFQARRLAYGLGLSGDLVKQATVMLKGLVNVFLKHDCSIAEINPLVRSKDGRLLALDGKINFDENALFRHPDIEKLRDDSEEDPGEVRSREVGISYVKLDGNIGCLVNGAGLAMSTMDIVHHFGGKPANFLDVGGGANVEQVTEAFRILLADGTVQGVLVNIFGGIMKCDTIATALIEAFKIVNIKVPVVVRLEGTNVELGKKLIRESGLPVIAADGLTDAARKIVAAVK